VADEAGRRLRRDAALNRERVLAAAVSAMLRDGRNVPLAAIAAEAGVGVGTLYRRYPDREALLQALEYRAYGLLTGILDNVAGRDLSGLDAVREFLSGSLAIAEQLVLPLHGAPPLVSAAAVEARRTINRRLEMFIERGRKHPGGRQRDRHHRVQCAHHPATGARTSLAGAGSAPARDLRGRPRRGQRRRWHSRASDHQR
jgi:AcrR family transcriptional regulator